MLRLSSVASGPWRQPVIEGLGFRSASGAARLGSDGSARCESTRSCPRTCGEPVARGWVDASASRQWLIDAAAMSIGVESEGAARRRWTSIGYSRSLT